jgi:NitT/TauT family transport system ATP-binding protein
VVIEDLRFELGQREIVALVGPSGCGKTTTLRIIAGLDRAFEGEIQWPEGAARRIGTMFQEPRLLPWRTVRQNLALVRPPDPALAAALLEELGVAASADLYPGALSLGMARRVALVRAFAVEPDLLLLDEPFVSLDPASAEIARALFIRTWRARPCAALLVTHDMAEATGLADRILMLSGEGCHVLRTEAVPPSQLRRDYFSVSR